MNNEKETLDETNSIDRVGESLLHPAQEFCKEIGLELCKGKGSPVTVSEGSMLSLKSIPGGVNLTYRTRSEFFRALTFLPDYFENGKEI